MPMLPSTPPTPLSSSLPPLSLALCSRVHLAIARRHHHSQPAVRVVFTKHVCAVCVCVFFKKKTSNLLGEPECCLKSAAGFALGLLGLMACRSTCGLPNTVVYSDPNNPKNCAQGIVTPPKPPHSFSVRLNERLSPSEATRKDILRKRGVPQAREENFGA